MGQMQAQQQGQAVSWAVRGLTSTAVQTQYCELWEANIGSSTGDSVLCTLPSSSSSGTSSSSGLQSTSSRGGSEDGAVAGEVGTTAAPAAAARVLALSALQQQIKEIYRAKAQSDLAAARGQRPFVPLPDFVASYLAQQSGSDGRAVQQRAQQLQASVEAHAEVFEVGMFGLSAGMLEEAAGLSAGGPAGTAVTAAAAQSGASCASASASPLAPPLTATSAAVPLVLYSRARARSGSRGIGPGAAECRLQQEAVLPALRRFSGASWHAAYQQSAARPPLPQPFHPAAFDQIHSMASEVHNLALSVPGVEQLMCWVLDGGLASCLSQLELGLRLAENQVRHGEGDGRGSCSSFPARRWPVILFFSYSCMQQGRCRSTAGCH